MKVIAPIEITDAVLIDSSIPENDHPLWNAATSYALGEQIIQGHRRYESALAGNLGNDPASSSSWIDLGPTNRWAMFDRAVGSASEAAGSIAVMLEPGLIIDAIGLLDVEGSTARVQVIIGGSPAYDETVALSGATVLFEGLTTAAAAQIIVTVSGTTASVGTLTIGTMIELGLTEASPSISIADYSRRSTDEFGVTTVIERSWAKVMSVRTLLNSGEVDGIQAKVAALRAVPALWIGEGGYDSLVLYGFFKEFSIDLSLPPISYCSLRIEGLT